MVAHWCKDSNRFHKQSFKLRELKSYYVNFIEITTKNKKRLKKLYQNKQNKDNLSKTKEYSRPIILYHCSIETTSSKYVVSIKRTSDLNFKPSISIFKSIINCVGNSSQTLQQL